MSRARTLADFISTGVGTGILADGAIDSTEITGVTVSSTEINRLAGVTSDVQTQINTKAATASLAAVATSGAYADVTGTPSLGTAAALNVGTSANNIPQLDSNAKLPAIDGSQLTGLGVTQGTLTKTFVQNETADITLSSSITSGCPVVSATKEVPQSGISTKGNWDVNSTASNYDFHNTAANVTLTPSTAVNSQVTSLTYANKTTTVNGSDTQALAFKSDGTKVFSSGSGGAVYEHSLSTAWDLSTKSYTTSFNHGSQMSNARGMFWKPDGTKFWLVGNNGNAFEYNVNSSYPWNLDYASYTSGTNINISSQHGTGSQGIFFKPDGTKMFIVDYTNDHIGEWALSTAWDITTASHTRNAGVVNTPKDIVFNSDGTVIYIVTATKITEYNCSTAYDLSTMTTPSREFDTSSQSTNNQGLTIRPDDSEIFIVNAVDNAYEYNFLQTNVLALGSGSFASTDVGKRIVGNGGDVVLTSTGGAFSTTGGSAFTDNSTIAAGSWSMFGLKSAGDASGLTIAGVTGSAYDFANATLDTTGSISNNLGSSLTLSPDGTKAVFSLKGGNTSTTAKFGSYSMSTPYDLTTLSETSTAQKPLASTSSFVNDEIALAFNPQGTYAIGVSTESHRFGRYSLSTAWDMSTATASFEQDIGSSFNFTDVLFNGDGTKIYVAEQNNARIYEINLSNAYAYSAESSFQNNYNLTALGASSHINYIYHLNWNSDGTKLFFGDNNKLLSVELTTAYSLQHIDNSTTQVVYTDNGKLSSIAVASDGTHLIYGQSNQLNVDSYSLQDLTQPTGQYHVGVTNAGGRIDSQYFTDINSMTAAESAGTGTAHYAVSTDGRTTWSVAKSTDGVRPIVRNNSGTWQYNSAESAWGISSAAYTNKSLNVNSIEPNPTGIFFKPDGTKMYMNGYTNDDVNEYNLSTAWDITTATYSQNFGLSSQDISSQGIFFKPDGTKMYMVGSGSDNINEYTLSTAWDVSTLSYVRNLGMPSGLQNPTGIFFKSDGTRMYIVADPNKAVMYSLSTAWDISTASVSHTHTISETALPQDIFLKSDGTKVYILGESSDQRVYEYNLSTAYDLSTISYSSYNFDVSSQATGCKGMTFKPDGSKMYIIGTDNDTIFEYNTLSYGTSTTWTNGTVNDELYTLQQALSVESNRMDKTQLDAVADANHFTLGNSLDLMIALRMDTAASTLPTSDGVTLNYDAAALNEGAVLGTDYDFFFPANNKVQIKSLAAQNLKVRVV